MSRVTVIRVIPSLAVLLLTSCAPSPPSDAPILLFNGTGTSPNDVKAVEAVLKGQRLKYATVNCRQLTSMSASQLTKYKLLIIPGGNYLTIGKSLTADNAAKIHDAVQAGLNYLGICAGGLLAGNGSSNSLNLTSGVRFDFYSAVNRGIHKEAVSVTAAGQPAIEQYWEDGPQFTGWGEVIGKYPDGTPAIVQGKFGKGWAILCGVHPEAPESWRRGFTTPAAIANSYAATLVESALKGTPLPHY